MGGYNYYETYNDEGFAGAQRKRSVVSIGGLGIVSVGATSIGSETDVKESTPLLQNVIVN